VGADLSPDAAFAADDPFAGTQRAGGVSCPTAMGLDQTSSGTMKTPGPQGGGPAARQTSGAPPPDATRRERAAGEVRPRGRLSRRAAIALGAAGATGLAAGASLFDFFSN